MSPIKLIHKQCSLLVKCGTWTCLWEADDSLWKPKEAWSGRDGGHEANEYRAQGVPSMGEAWGSFTHREDSESTSFLTSGTWARIFMFLSPLWLFILTLNPSSMKFSKIRLTNFYFYFSFFFLLETNGKVFIFRNLLPKITLIMCQMQNMRSVYILTPTKQKQTNKNGCLKSDVWKGWTMVS